MATDGAAPGTRRVRLPARILRHLRMALLTYAAPGEAALELIEERYEDGLVQVRLARPDGPRRGERILGSYRPTGSEAPADEERRQQRLAEER